MQRLAMGLTQRQLAALLGVSQPTIFRWERDTVEPHARQWDRLGRALGIHPMLLIGDRS